MTSDLCANTDLITTGKLNDELFCFNLINRLYVISCILSMFLVWCYVKGFIRDGEIKKFDSLIF